MDATFREVAEATVDDLLRLRPELATDLGEHAHDDRLDDLSPAALAGERQLLAGRRDELDSLDLDALDAQEAVDADILRSGLDQRIFALEVLQETTWNPLVWLPGEALHPLLARATVPLPDRLRALAARLAQVPDRLLLARSSLGPMPRIHVETALSRLPGVAALARDEVSRLAVGDPGFAAVLAPAQDAALTALGGFREWLLEQLPLADRDPRLGPEVYAAKLHLTLDADLAAGDVVRLAREHLEEVSAELVRTAREWTGSEDVRGALDRVAAEAPDDAGIVALAGRTLAETTEAVRRSGMLELPDQECVVQVMPEFRRGVAVAYCDAPGPLEQGGETFFAISPAPVDWPAERVASLYREYNTAMVTNLTVHEAMPGHVTQLALARRFRGSTRVRQVLASGSFVEGWAVHAERLMAETGHGGVPVRLQQLKMQLRMTLNALLDAGVHSGGMGEGEALALMTDVGFQEEAEAAGKWRRALLTSAQLSTYFVGWAELDPVLRGRTTYDDVLAHGSPPPRHLPALLAAP